nr:MAG TPA: hypothetical protein [Bacteriophage sp.]
MIRLNGRNCLCWCRTMGQAKPFFLSILYNKQC